MDMLLGKLREFDALRDPPGDGRNDIVVPRDVPGAAPDLAPSDYLKRLPSWAPTALKDLGIDCLYAHQAQAISHILAGDNVVLEAPTASGKTLCFNIPLLSMLIRYPQAHALMIHPMKALSNDQRRQYEELAKSLSATTGRKLDSWIVDGDLEQEHRSAIKSSPPALILTNPEMLHLSFLQWHEQWEEKFLKSLKLVIIDEIHEYRGYFGTNVALLLRRFFAFLRRLGAQPQVVLATATCGNAEEHAYRLTGRRCRLVRAERAMRPHRSFAFITPGIPDFKYHVIYQLRIARAALACVARGLTTLVFCPTRKFAEEAAKHAKQDAIQRGISPETIVPYRSGYDAELRRKIEKGLRDGQYTVVFSTNALEIGIDIGRLDACILAGFPDSAFSAWQRIGRVGRSWNKKAYVLFFASNNPFDRFYAGNIDAFLSKPLDEILIGVDNEELMGKHLPYLVYELGSAPADGDCEQLGAAFFEFARKTLAGKKPYKGLRPAYPRLNVRGASGLVSNLIFKGQPIGTISDAQLFREAYVGAVYNHFNRSYRVVGHGAGEVLLDDVDPDYRTDPMFFTVVAPTEICSGLRYHENLIAAYGKLTKFENFTGYRTLNSKTGEVIDEQRSELSRRTNVRGFWLELTNSSILESSSTVEALFGLEQLLRIGGPFVVPCDRHDLGTLTVTKRPESVHLYENVPGGIGVAEKALVIWPEVIRTGISIAEGCKCRHGCPSCIIPPRLPRGFDEPKKALAITIGRKFLEISASGQRERFDPDTHSWVPDR